eukprot:CAMPEP_0174374236 /NCGR_PEP_ID=MMETSP0811_2-20130205/110139_1 /TAXON_ID=73025 ORGANISM="Eutreptiella gymnastica-like, Strain CCMP1594" /NCGR_SAMPLE_ID=MMETSP0811_2 /ASSEMBLY_ACC=CAM_ASM_000667 /LENGTH=135 /DNA_ID=CAMNT_0015523367 /DNA_START=61 /DNA_END=465 /DNA_ORIENTATION=+
MSAKRCCLQGTRQTQLRLFMQLLRGSRYFRPYRAAEVMSRPTDLRDLSLIPMKIAAHVAALASELPACLAVAQGFEDCLTSVILEGTCHREDDLVMFGPSVPGKEEKTDRGEEDISTSPRESQHVVLGRRQGGGG